MRGTALALAAILILSNASGYILVYTKGFKYPTSRGEGTYLSVQSVDTILETWRNWGFSDIVESQKIDPAADGIIVLGCTELSDEDAEKLLEYIQKGGRAVLDLQCSGKIDDVAAKIGVVRNAENYRGTVLRDLQMPYVTVKGYPVDTPVVIKDSPTASKYAAMVYAGPTLSLVGKSVSSLFITPAGKDVAFMAEYGEGRIYGTGCLLCSNQTLMANILDWAEDGDIDFPAVRINRRAYPPVKKVGEPFYDEISVDLGEYIDAARIDVRYVYDEAGYCPFTPTLLPETEEGTRKVLKYEYYPDSERECYLGPATVRVEWISPEGTYIREFVVPGPYVQVITGAIPVEPSKWPYYALAGIILLIGAFFVYREYRRRAKIRELREEIATLEDAIKDLERRYMTRRIADDVYKELLKSYMKELEEKKAELRKREKASPPPHVNIGSGGKGSGNKEKN